MIYIISINGKLNYVNKNINLNFSDGIFVFKDKSGSGKSILFETILGHYGFKDINISVKINNNIVSGKEVEKYCYLYSQKTFLFESLTIEKLFQLQDIDAHDVVDELSSLNITSNVKEKIKYLSAGQKARLRLILAKYSNKPIILIDEPLASLDVETSVIAIDYIKKHFKDKIVLIASHKKVMHDNFKTISIFDEFEEKKETNIIYNYNEKLSSKGFQVSLKSKTATFPLLIILTICISLISVISYVPKLPNVQKELYYGNYYGAPEGEITHHLSRNELTEKRDMLISIVVDNFVITYDYLVSIDTSKVDILQGNKIGFYNFDSIDETSLVNWYKVLQYRLIQRETPPLVNEPFTHADCVALIPTVTTTESCNKIKAEQDKKYMINEKAFIIKDDIIAKNIESSIGVFNDYNEVSNSKSDSTFIFVDKEWGDHIFNNSVFYLDDNDYIFADGAHSISSVKPDDRYIAFGTNHTVGQKYLTYLNGIADVLPSTTINIVTYLTISFLLIIYLLNYRNKYHQYIKRMYTLGKTKKESTLYLWIQSGLSLLFICLLFIPINGLIKNVIINITLSKSINFNYISTNFNIEHLPLLIFVLVAIVIIQMYFYNKFTFRTQKEN